METLTAAAARQITANSEQYKLDKIHDLIKYNAMRGANSLMIYEPMHPDSISTLERAGFEVTTNCESIRISW